MNRTTVSTNQLKRKHSARFDVVAHCPSWMNPTQARSPFRASLRRHERLHAQRSARSMSSTEARAWRRIQQKTTSERRSRRNPVWHKDCGPSKGESGERRDVYMHNTDTERGRSCLGSTRSAGRQRLILKEQGVPFS
jgi:hypothetical protein